MLITSSLGIGFNVLNIILLEYCFNPEKKQKQEDEENKEEDKKRQINVRAACFSIASNLIQSIGLFLAAGLIYIKPEWKIADPIMTYIFSVIVIYCSFQIFLPALKILLEFAPASIDLEKLKESLSEFGTVLDLHVWCISDDKVCLTTHLVAR